MYAPAAARVLEAGNNEEIGDYLVLDLGNDYTVTCGQLKEITAVQEENIWKPDSFWAMWQNQPNIIPSREATSSWKCATGIKR